MVKFTLSSILTSSELEISSTEAGFQSRYLIDSLRPKVENRSKLDFGTCSIVESVVLEMKIRNPSILIQEFGFLNLPESIRIKPSFGEIIPGEEIILKVYFSAEKAQIYNLEFELSTLRGFQATFQAKGVGVHPPLMASQSKLEFETPLYDSSRKQFSIRNEHFDKDQYKHPVPRIGPDGTIFPVGSTSFSIQEPADSGLVFSPCVGTIKPGEEMVISGFRDPPTLILFKNFGPILMY